MEHGGVLKWRHNTQNRGYGFEMTLDKPTNYVPTKAAGYIPDGDFPYKYTVAGNYK